MYKGHWRDHPPCVDGWLHDWAEYPTVLICSKCHVSVNIGPPLKPAFNRQPGNKSKRRQVIASLLRRDGAQCRYCQKPFTELLFPTIEHLVPRSRGGSSSGKHNLALSCSPCNGAKGSMTDEEFIALLHWLNSQQSASDLQEHIG